MFDTITMISLQLVNRLKWTNAENIRVQLPQLRVATETMKVIRPVKTITVMIVDVKADSISYSFTGSPRAILEALEAIPMGLELTLNVNAYVKDYGVHFGW